MSSHSILSASGAERWSRCPISVMGRDARVTSEAAAEGTALHSVSEMILGGGVEPELGSMLDAEGFKFEYNDDRKRAVGIYVDFVRSLPWVGGFQIEQRVKYGSFLGAPDELAYGTADVFGFTRDADGDVLRVIDAKFGRRPVSSQNNMQAALYAAGVLQALDPVVLPREYRVEVTIVQPRLGVPVNWSTTVGEIEDMVATLKPAAQAAVKFFKKEEVSGFAENPGEHCRYCSRKSECKTFQAQLVEASTPGKTVEWNPTLFALRDAIRGYLDDMEELALDLIQQGNKLPGVKVVRGRAGNLKLAVVDTVIRERAKQLGVEGMVVRTEEVWATPAKIRDALRKAGATPEEINKYFESPEGKLTVVSADDPRQEVDLSHGFQAVARL